jgi:hypothetical protein
METRRLVGLKTDFRGLLRAAWKERGLAADPGDPTAGDPRWAEVHGRTKEYDVLELGWSAPRSDPGAAPDRDVLAIVLPHDDVAGRLALIRRGKGKLVCMDAPRRVVLRAWRFSV